MNPVVFAQIHKVDEERRIVYGRAAEEVADRSGEIFDYTTSKPYFEQWSESVQKDSNGKSLGNVRSMHGNVAAGKLVEMVFKDEQKAIDIAAKIVDDNEWKKVLEGVHTGFSIGGSYVSRQTEMVDGKELKRYTANPNEISLVDRPCIPTAKFFDVMKADGSVTQVAFKWDESQHPRADNGQFARGDIVSVKGRSGEFKVGAVGERLQIKTKFGTDVGFVNPRDVKLIRRPKPVVPGKNSAGETFFAPLKSDAPEDLTKVVNPDSEDNMTKATLEKAPAEGEEDTSKAPPAEGETEGKAPPAEGETEADGEGAAEKVAKADGEEYTVEGSAEDVEALSNVMNQEQLSVANVVEMVKAHLSIAPLLIEPDLTKADAAESLEPAVEQLAALLKVGFTDTVEMLIKVGARNSRMDQDQIQKIHDCTVGLLAKCAAADKVEPEGDLAKGAAPEDAIQKAVATAMEPLQKRLEDTEKLLTTTQEQLKKLAAQPAPTRAALRVVAKGQDVGGEEQNETQVAPVAIQGQVNEAATLIKAAHKQGGHPLLRKD